MVLILLSLYADICSVPCLVCTSPLVSGPSSVTLVILTKGPLGSEPLALAVSNTGQIAVIAHPLIGIAGFCSWSTPPTADTPSAALTARNSPFPTGTRLVVKLVSLLTSATNGAICSG